MFKIIQMIIGLAIVILGVRIWNSDMGLRVALAVIVFGVLVMLNTTKKKKEEEDDEEEW